MPIKVSTERYREFCKRKMDKGLVRVAVWIKPEDRDKLRVFLYDLYKDQSGS